MCSSIGLASQLFGAVHGRRSEVHQPLRKQMLAPTGRLPHEVFLCARATLQLQMLRETKRWEFMRYPHGSLTCDEMECM